MLLAEVLQLIHLTSRSTGFLVTIGELQVDLGLSESVPYILVLYSESRVGRGFVPTLTKSMYLLEAL